MLVLFSLTTLNFFLSLESLAFSLLCAAFSERFSLLFNVWLKPSFSDYIANITFSKKTFWNFPHPLPLPPFWVKCPSYVSLHLAVLSIMWYLLYYIAVSDFRDQRSLRIWKSCRSSPRKKRTHHKFCIQFQRFYGSHKTL